MNEVEEFIFNQAEKQRELLLFFHILFLDKYELKPKLKYKIPFYYRKKWVVYLNTTNSGIEISFIKGYQFKGSWNFLESKNRKMVRSFSCNSLEDIPSQELDEIMKEALEVDEIQKNT